MVFSAISYFYLIVHTFNLVLLLFPIVTIIVLLHIPFFFSYFLYCLYTFFLRFLSIFFINPYLTLFIQT